MIDLIKYFSVLLITYLGLVAGVLIANYTKEELKPGKKYFQWLNTFVFSAIFFIFMLHLKILLIVAISLTLLATFFTHILGKRLRFININMFFYSFFAVLFYEMWFSEYLIILSNLIFIFGLGVGAIKSLKYEKLPFSKKIKKLLTENSLYLILAVVLVFVYRT